MKKILVVTLVAFCAIGYASAQARAIGARLGYNFEVSYQHSLSDNTFLEFDGGLFNYGNGFQVSCQHNWLMDIPWSHEGEWNWYAGIGGGLGYRWWNNNHSGFNIAAVPQIGVEYTFWFPLQLSIDFRPRIGIYFNDGAAFDNWGVGDLALAVRYRL